MTTESAPMEEQFITEARPLLTQAAALVIASAEDDEVAARYGAAARAGIKRVEEFFRPLKRSADAHKRALLDAEAKSLAPFEEVKAIVDRLQLDWQRELRRREEERRRALEEEARKAEEARRAAEVKAAEERALALDAAGKTDEAVAALDEAQAIADEPPAPVSIYVPPTPPAPQPKGRAIVTTWDAEVTDKLALIRFVAANPTWVHLLDINTTAARAAARSLKGEMMIPGLRAVARETVSQRSL